MPSLTLIASNTRIQIDCCVMLRCVAVYCDLAWRGVAVYCDLVWRGVAWRGVAWRGVAWRGLAWLGVVVVCAGADAGTMLRSDFFPGLGWMLTKAMWEELGPKCEKRKQ
jgi:hypothetical protein